MNLGIGNNPLIIGLGQTGKSCIAYFESINQPYHLLDSRPDVKGSDALRTALCQSITFNGLDADLQDQKAYLQEWQISSLIVSPGVRVKGPLFDAAKALQLEILGDVELFARLVQRQSDAHVIAITGSNGKSTVTKLLHDLMDHAGMSVSMGGNIGVPVLQLLKTPTDWYVLEVSSFQLETTRNLVADIATVLNVTEDHLDRYDSFADYKNTKLTLLDMAERQIIDADELGELLEQYPQAKSFSLNQPSDPDLYWDKASNEVAFTPTPDQLFRLDMKRARLPGLHNIRNVMTTLAIWQAAGFVWSQQLSQFLYDWTGLAHRCEFVKRVNGVAYYNDSKATNVGATEAAIKGFASTTDSPIILIAGGVGKDADFSSLAELFKESLSLLIVLGQDAKIILQQAGQGVPSAHVRDMAEAVSKAHAEANEGDIVLLSPACASLDMYQNYERRGEHFVTCVEALS